MSVPIRPIARETMLVGSVQAALRTARCPSVDVDVATVGAVVTDVAVVTVVAAVAVVAVTVLIPIASREP
jgi:hypothetical protein